MHAKILLFVKPNNYKSFVVSLWGFFFSFLAHISGCGIKFRSMWLALCRLSLSLSPPSSLPYFLFKKKTRRAIPDEDEFCSKEKRKKERKLIESWDNKESWSLPKGNQSKYSFSSSSSSTTPSIAYLRCPYSSLISSLPLSISLEKYTLERERERIGSVLLRNHTEDRINKS